MLRPPRHVALVALVALLLGLGCGSGARTEDAPPLVVPTGIPAAPAGASGVRYPAPPVAPAGTSIGRRPGTSGPQPLPMPLPPDPFGPGPEQLDGGVVAPPPKKKGTQL